VRWIENTSDLLITIVIVFEHAMEEFQFWEMSLVTDVPSSLYQGG